MRPSEFFEWMARCEETGELTLSPGPFTIRVNKNDLAAARLIAKLAPEYEDATVGEFENVFLNAALNRMSEMDEASWHDDKVQIFLFAWWWAVFFAAQCESEE